MAKTLRSWGVQYQPNDIDIPHSYDYQCLKCGWNYFSVKNYDNIVGFHKLDVPQYGILLGLKKIGILIIECPKCFSRFWIHIMESSAEFIMENSSDWPEDNP